MRLSMAAELAVRGILCLAERYGQGPVPIDEICRTRCLPKQYLTKIFALLTRADLVSPLRGKGGGYVLARDPKDITLLAVVEAVEGPLALNLCLHTPPKCERHECRVRPLWAEIQESVRRVLSSKSLAELVGDGLAHAERRR